MTTCSRFTETVVGGRRVACKNPVAAAGSWCKRCKGYKSSKVPSSGAPTAHQTPRAPQHPAVGAVAPHQVGQCEAEVSEQHGVATARRCKNAVLVPERLCFQHGGEEAGSLLVSFAKAKAMAQRGELRAPSQGDYDTHEDVMRARMEADVIRLLSHDPSAYLRMVSASQNFVGEHSVGRFSPGNQFMILSWLYHYQVRDCPDDEQALNQAISLMGEPTHTAKGWEKLGRTVTADARPLHVLFGGSRSVVFTTEDEDGNERTVRRQRRSFGSHAQYVLSDTAGEPLEAPVDPLTLPVQFSGDVASYRSTLDRVAKDAGVSIVETSTRPMSGAAAHFNPRDRVITLWTGVGDEATQAHTLAHEIGHVLDPKLNHAEYTCNGNERGRAEVFAEAFAYLASSRHGVDAVESSRGYLEGWSQALGGLSSREAMRVLADAANVVVEMAQSSAK